MSYLEDVWYCAALADELTTKPIRRVICDLPIVLYRTESGKVAALEDRCSHRQAPLSAGVVQGEEIQCLYHGFVFDCTGACTFIPQQDTAPASAAIRAFPLVEKHGFVWLWWGENGKEDQSLIPDLPWIDDDENYRTVFFRFYVQANHQLMADNLLDVSHIDFLHRKSIGSLENQKGQKSVVEFESHRDGEVVHAIRRVPNAQLAGTAAKWMGNSERAQRLSTQMWEKPNTVHINLKVKNELNAIEIIMAHLMTPETASSTHYFMNWTRDFGLENKGYPTDEDIRQEQVSVVEDEDIPMVEAQQQNIVEFGSDMDVAARQDHFVGLVHQTLQDIYRDRGMTFPPEVVRTVKKRRLKARAS